MKRLASILFAIACTATALGGASQAALAAGNSDIAHACQGGGYVNFVRADGSIFQNRGDCVRYGAHGGVLVPVALTATFVSNPTRGGFQDLTVTGSGLLPGSTVTDTYIPVGQSAPVGPFPTFINSTVAPDGTFFTSGQTGCPLDHTFTFFATTAYGAPITATGC